MVTSTRLLRLLALMSGRAAWTGRDLAERLEVTERTLRRDVARLRELGYPVDSVPGPAGGYRLGRGSVLPPVPLDDEEAVAVALALRSAAGGGVPGLDDAMLTALAKLQQLLPGRLAARVEVVGAATVRLPGANADPVDPDTLLVLAQACRRQTAVRIGYSSGAGSSRVREVEPLRIVHAGRRWYLAAYDVAHADWRTLRLDRITSVRDTGRPFRHENPPDPVELVAHGTSMAPYPIQARVRLDTTRETAARYIPRTVGRVVDDETDAGRCVLELGGSSMEWLVGYLAAMPVGWEVLEPVEVRHAAAQLGSRIATRNGPT